MPKTSRLLKSALADKSIVGAFGGMIGADNIDPGILYEKYARIKEHVERFLLLLRTFRDTRLMAHFPDPRGHLAAYVAALEAQAAESFSAPALEEYLRPPAGASVAEAVAAMEDYDRVPPEVLARFREVFTAAKNCNVVRIILTACRTLKTHEASLKDANAVKNNFLTRSAMMAFAPLPDLPQVNFKQIYIDDRLDSGQKQCVLIVLSKMFTISHDVYKAVTAPEFNVDSFVELVTESLEQVKGKIPRCGDAFKKIVESVDLLKTRFDTYYQDFAVSGNVSIIIENFVIDVAAQDKKQSPALIAQFRRIIEYYKAHAAENNSLPEFQGLFKQIDSNFDALNAPNAADDADDDTATQADDDDAAATLQAGDDTAPQPDGAAPPPAVADPEAARNAAKRNAKKKRQKAKRSGAEDASGASPGETPGAEDASGASPSETPGETPGAPPGETPGEAPGGGLFEELDAE